MRSHSDEDTIRAAWRLGALAALVALLAGCVSMSGEKPDTAARRAVEPTRPVPERNAREREAPATDSTKAESTPQPAPDVLADRKRGDFPEIRTDAAGFTITEQIHIPGNVRADYERAQLLLQQERFADGIAALESIVEEAPGVTAPYIDLGIAYRRTGDLEHAEEALKTAARLSPDHPIVHNELGIVYRQMGRFNEARAEYEKALAVFADFHYARRNLAVLCDLYLFDTACAIDNYSAYVDGVGGDADVEVWIADLKNRLASAQ